MFFKRISGLVFRLLILFLLGLPAVSRAARLILPVEDDFLKGSILQKGGGPTGSLLYEGLITRNTQGGYDGWLAHSWESHDNARVWRFSLVTRATWHDGVPFTAHDVKFTYDYMTEKQLWLASVLWMVEKVECPDDHTVVFRLKRSFPKFLDRLSHCPGIVIIPRHIWKSIENPMRYEDQHYIGTGPLQFVKKIPGQFFEMKPYAGYHGGIVPSPQWSCVI
jgi:peptide/nickel transport system substrate-binding protein